MKNSQSSLKRVLVVEDEPLIAQVCQRVLTREGFEVDTAIGGDVAQAMMERKDYDLCLIDIRTPGMNGQELYQWLREKRPNIVQKVIFTTGDTMGEDTQCFLEQSGRPSLAKPFTPEELRTIVKEALKEIAE